MKTRNIGTKEYQEIKACTGQFNEANDCAVIAVALTCRTDYKTARGALKLNGRLSRRGTMFSITERAVKSLGYQVKAVENIFQPNGSRYTPKTIGQKLGRGYWLCAVKGHIFAVVNGMVLDWSAGSCKRIIRIHRVTKQEAA